MLSARTRHLADRFTYGVDPGTAADISSYADSDAWFDAQLRQAAPEEPRALLVPAWFPQLRNPPALTAQLHNQGTRSSYQAGLELIAQTFARRILSRHQVQESMVDFWSNLLYIPANDARSFPWRPDYDARVIRPHALGSYRQLLRAAVIHPAMAGYLSNDLNAKGALNENLGRELLELYTVGNRYRERDVRHAAKMLTGFTVNVFTDFDARYDPARHVTGPIKVLEFTHPNRDPDGRKALGQMLDYLALRPATAERIAHRLCVRFVRDDPPARLVKAMAETYLATRSDIKATLRTLVRSDEFQRNRRGKTYTPSDDVVRAARVLGLRPTGGTLSAPFIYDLVGLAEDMGQVPFRWPRPDGWPETTAEYLSAARVLRGWHHHFRLAATVGDLAHEVEAPDKASELPARWPQKLSDLVDHQSRRLIGRPASDEVVAAVASVTGLAASHRYSVAAEVDDGHYRLMRGIVLNSPDGLQR